MKITLDVSVDHPLICSGCGHKNEFSSVINKIVISPPVIRLQLECADCGGISRVEFRDIRSGYSFFSLAEESEIIETTAMGDAARTFMRSNPTSEDFNILARKVAEGLSNLSFDDLTANVLGRFDISS